jgi:hypothetical protein
VLRCCFAGGANQTECEVVGFAAGGHHVHHLPAKERGAPSREDDRAEWGRALLGETAWGIAPEAPLASMTSDDRRSPQECC